MSADERVVIYAAEYRVVEIDVGERQVIELVQERAVVPPVEISRTIEVEASITPRVIELLKTPAVIEVHVPGIQGADGVGLPGPPGPPGQDGQAEIPSFLDGGNF